MPFVPLKKPSNPSTSQLWDTSPYLAFKILVTSQFYRRFPRLELPRQIHRVAPKARRRGHGAAHGGVHAVRAQQVVVADRGAGAGEATTGGKVHLFNPKSGG